MLSVSVLGAVVPAVAPGSVRALALLGIGVSSIVDAVLGQISSWVATGAVSFVVGVGHALDATSSVPLSGGFIIVFRAMQRVGAQFAALFLAVAAVQAVVRQDLAGFARTVVLRLPLALVASALGVEVVSLSLSATDALSGSVLGAAGGAAGGYLNALAMTLSGAGGVQLAGFEGLLLAVLAAAVAFVLWVELAIRSAAVAVATLFIPLALAGVVWPATAHWARRLGETIAALVLAKLVIAATLSLAVALIGQPTGPSGLVEGIALLVLAALSPFSVLRVVGVADAGALEGLGRRAVRAATAGVETAGALLGAPGDESVLGPGPVGVDLLPGQTFSGPEFEAEVAAMRARMRPDLAGEGSQLPEDEDH